MRPMPRLDAKARNPVHSSSAGRAVEHEASELPFELGLHVQKLEPEHPGLERDGVRAAEPVLERFMYKRIRGRSLLAHGVHRSFQDT